MKKLTAIILTICVVLSCTTAFAANTTIIIDGGQATSAEGMGSIVEKDNRTFVPVRFLLAYFKFNVDWDDDTQTVLGVNKDGDSFLMQVGNKNLFFFQDNGQKKDIIEMDVAPFLNNQESRVYVPLRFIAQAIGYDVGWDGATETVTITKK